MNETTEHAMLCKCCGELARWCYEDGPHGEACGSNVCSDIQCDHCDMHYSLESVAMAEAETVEDARILMAKAYYPKPLIQKLN